MAGAAFGEVHVSFFVAVAGAACGEIWNGSRSGKRCSWQVRKVALAARRVQFCVFRVLCSTE